MTKWDDVAEAIQRTSVAYLAVLASRNDDREGSKRSKAAEREWTDAVNHRAAALESHWTEEDGYQVKNPELHSLAKVLQRYYAETLLAEKKGAKRAH